MSTHFDNADVYDACDNDSLDKETPEEAVVERVEQLLDPRTEATLEQQVLAVGEIEVTAFSRESIAPQFVRNLLERLAETVSDAWAEDYGNTEEMDSLPEDSKEEFARNIEVAVYKLLGSKDVYRCLPVGSRVYSPKEVLDIFKEERPEDFEEQEVKP
jgi:hypothetical protein